MTASTADRLSMVCTVIWIRGRTRWNAATAAGSRLSASVGVTATTTELPDIASAATSGLNNTG